MTPSPPAATGAQAVEVALLDCDGVIVSVNQAWEDFCRGNGGDPARCGTGTSYLAACAVPDLAAAEVEAAVRCAVRGELTAPLRIVTPCPRALGDGVDWFDTVICSRFDEQGECLGATLTISPLVAAAGPPSPRRNRGFPELTSAVSDRAFELTSGVGHMLQERDRLANLLAATRSMATNLTLAALLRQIVISSRALTGARHAALEVLDDSGGLADLIQVDDPHTRLPADRQEQAASPGSPDSRAGAVLSVPIRIRGRVFGTLHVIEKSDGPVFTQDDRDQLVTLAATAAVAIDKARLYEDITRRNRWREASLRVTNALLGDPGADSLGMISTEVERLVRADSVVLVQATGSRTLRVLAAVGRYEKELRAALEGHGLAGTVAEQVYTSGRFVSDDIAQDERLRRAVNTPPVGPVIAVQFAVGRRNSGVIVATRARDGAPFGTDEIDVLDHFAQQAALSMELVQAREHAERVTVLEERERIARDIHDNVIGRIFGVGLALSALTATLADPTEQARWEYQLGELDAALRQLRTTIYTPHASPGPAAGTLADGVRELLVAAAESLGFTPTATIDDSVSIPATSRQALNVLAVLRESLTNIARHAQARAVHVTLRVGAEISLTVTDDGVGLAEPTPHAPHGGHGMVNMARRAAQAGGSFSVGTPLGGGTVLRWSAPT